MTARFGTIALAIGLSGCGGAEQSTLYAKPVADASAELFATAIPDQVTAAIARNHQRVVKGPDSIEWHFGIAGDSIVFTATPAADDPGHTRVTLAARLDRNASSTTAPYYATPMILEVVKDAMSEQVAAELQDRAFDDQAFGRQMKAYIAAHPEQQQGAGRTVEITMKGNMIQRSDAGAASPAGAEPAPTRSDPTVPTTDLARYQ